MKKWFLLIAVFALVFSACDTSVGSSYTEGPAEGKPTTVDTPSNAPEDTAWTNDSRTTMVDASSYKWMRKPSTARGIVYNIADGDPIAAYCTEPGWAYIFYDDQAVIGYEPFPDRVDIMQRAVITTVEVHNRDNPLEEWGFINVPMPYTSPVTSNDPVLGKWQFSLCIDTGEIVDGPYTAEFDWEWAMWKSNVASTMRDSYNLSHDPEAHIVWGTDE